MGPRTPKLNYANYNYTFPAVTINFYLPELNLTDDPWEYILSQYSVYFRNDMLDNNKVQGVPCDTVPGYAKETLEQADLGKLQI